MNINIGKNLRKVRKHLKLKQNEFAKKLGVSGGQISAIELGKTSGSESLFQLIELKYQVNRQWLETGEGSMFNEKPALHSDPTVENLIDQKNRANTDLSSLNDTEKRIIRMFRKLSPERKQRIIDLVTDAFIAAQE